MNDKVIKCKDCGSEFVFSVGEQEFYKEKGFENEPVRCVSCRKIRKEQNLTQKSLSKSVNIHRTHYSMIENGRRNPSLKVAVSIKKALNYQYDDIFEKQ